MINGSLTMGEIASVESLSGQPISAMGDENAPKGKLMAALAYVTKKREDASYTFEQAMNLTMEQVTEILGLDDDEDPKEEN